MKSPLPEHIRNLLWRWELTPEDRALLDSWLAEHPETRATLEEDLFLTSALQRLPDAPVATNFTTRVLGELERPDRAHARPSRPLAPLGWLSGWLPRAAVAAVVVGLSLFGWHQHRASVRAELVRSMAENIAGLGPEIIENFDSVRRVNPVVPDQILLTALERAVE